MTERPGRPHDETSPLLEGRGLRVPGSGEQRAPLAGPVEVRLVPGDVLAVEGASGAGKSTLLRCLAQLEPRAEGSVTLRGESTAVDEVPAFRRQVVYLPQQAPRGPVRGDAFWRRAFAYKAAGASYDEARAAELARELALPDDIAGRELGSLSGGELARVALVRALLLSPAVLLLDEPTAALDRAARGRVAGLLRTWLAEGGRAAAVVAHDDTELDALVTARLRLEAGRPEAG